MGNFTLVTHKSYCSQKMGTKVDRFARTDSYLQNRRRFEISEMYAFVCSKQPDMVATNDVTVALVAPLRWLVGCPHRFTFNFLKALRRAPQVLTS